MALGIDFGAFGMDGVSAAGSGKTGSAAVAHDCGDDCTGNVGGICGNDCTGNVGNGGETGGKTTTTSVAVAGSATGAGPWADSHGAPWSLALAGLALVAAGWQLRRRTI